MPGQTRSIDPVDDQPHRPSMEGRAIARPNAVINVQSCIVQVLLQWRAGQLPGQTAVAAARPGRRRGPSMEGRAIARPNRATVMTTMRGHEILQWRAGQLPGQTPRTGPPPRTTSPTFNGGPGNCPAKRAGDAARGRVVGVPSMEGRAIARPNLAVTSPFTDAEKTLQWRAGQLPGQTREVADHQPERGARPFNGGPGNCPAKRGRRSGRRTGGRGAFNGGPGNCPAKLRAGAAPDQETDPLQWRAGQLPGQTTGGRDDPEGAAQPSMEGRAIARPNPSRSHVAPARS